MLMQPAEGDDWGLGVIIGDNGKENGNPYGMGLYWDYIGGSIGGYIGVWGLGFAVGGLGYRAEPGCKRGWDNLITSTSKAV